MITKKVFNDLAIYMIGFGVLIGIIFPFFVSIAGVPSYLVITPLFFLLCIAAGFIVGLINIFLARKIVGKKLKMLSQHMLYVENRLINNSINQNLEECTDEKCYITVDSDDEIGESAHAFNASVNLFLTHLNPRLRSEHLQKCYQAVWNLINWQKRHWIG